MKRKAFFPLLALVISSIAVSCSKNDDPMTPSSQSSTITIKNTTQVKDFSQNGKFQGSGTPPMISPGQSIEIKFSAGTGQTLAFATMYGLSKDWFFAPANPGLMLFDANKKPLEGDVSNQIKLWDNGTKDNITGATESKVIKEVSGIDASKLMKLNLSYNVDKSEFTLKITNSSMGTANETPFSPGVWVVSNIFNGELLNSKPFFEADKMSNAEITAIAEMGNTSSAYEKSEKNTGIITGLSPLVVVVYNDIENPIFKVGTKDYDKGLKEVAQMGHADELVKNLRAMKGVKSVTVVGSGPIVPNKDASAVINGSVGDKIAFVSMFGYSNDWFFGNTETISFNNKGDITSKVKIYDNGTAKDQFPGAGNAQALFGGTAIVESVNIQEIGSAFNVPASNNFINISLK